MRRASSSSSSPRAKGRNAMRRSSAAASSASSQQKMMMGNNERTKQTRRSIREEEEEESNGRLEAVSESSVRPVVEEEEEEDHTLDKSKKKSSKKKKRKGGKSKSSKRSEPSGFVSSCSAGELEDAYFDDERNPLTATAEHGHQHYHEDVEDFELFDDTFTFLMTAAYPLDSCCKSKPEVEESKQEYSIGVEGFCGQDEGHEGEDDHDTQGQKSRAKTMVSTTNSLLDDVDPDYLCLPFWTGMFVITSQFFIYTVVIANVFQRNTLPPNADTWLRLAQIFAVIVTLYTQADFIDGIFLITERWKAFQEVTTPLKFNFSAILRVVAGNIGIVATFVLVMFSTEVVDLLLNFTAMEFVAALDNSAFEVAAKGFLGVTLEKKCLIIQEFRYKRRMRRGSWARILMYIVYVFLVFGAFLTIVSLQATRSVGVDNEVYVQFDDTDVSELFGISGVYKGCQHFKTPETGRIGYIDIGLECPEKTPEVFPARTFLYCWDLEGYVYIDQKTDEPCTEGNYLIRSFLDEASVASNSFDILTHAKANWVISGAKTKFGSEAFLTNFVIDSVFTFQTNFKNCGEDSAGLVDFFTRSRRPYRPLEFSETFYPTEEDKDGNFLLYSDIFDLVYRPVYVRPICGYINRYQMVLYDGLRWNYIQFNPVAYAESIGKVDQCGVIQTVNEEVDCQVDYPRDSGCWKIFLQYFHSDISWRSNHTVAVHEAISAPMIFLSPTDFGVPTAGLTWFEPNIVEGRIEPGKPYTASEDEDNDALLGGGEEGVIPLFRCEATINAECGKDEVQLTVTLTTDSFDSETRVLAFYGKDLSGITNLVTPHEVTTPKQTDKFTITENELTELRFEKAESSFVLGACVPAKDQCVQVLVGDTYGDGIRPPGEFAFQYSNDPSVGDRSGDSFRCKSYQFGPGCADSEFEQGGDCEDVFDDVPEPEVEQDTSANNPSNFYDSSDIVPFSNTLSPVSGSDDIFSIDGETSIPTLTLFCTENEIEFLVQVRTDSFSEETSVLLFFGQSLDDISDLTTARETSVESRSGEFDITEGVLTELSFEGDVTTFLVGSCIPSSAPCLQIIVLDSCGDGFSSISMGNYTFSYGTEESVFGDGNQWGCRSYQFGPGCVNTPPSIPSSCFGSEIFAGYPENIEFDSI